MSLGLTTMGTKRYKKILEVHDKYYTVFSPLRSHPHFTSVICCILYVPFYFFFNSIRSDYGLNVNPKPFTCFVILLFVTYVTDYIHLIVRQRG